MGWSPDSIKPCDMCKRPTTPPERVAAVKNVLTPHRYLFIVEICTQCYEAECKGLGKESPDEP